MPDLLKGKNILVMGVANERSIGWAIARAIYREGGQVFLSCQETLLDRVKALAPQISNPPVFVCDVNEDSQISALVENLREHTDHLNGLVHSIAFAPREELRGDFAETSREGFRIALETSAYSLVTLARAVRPLMSGHCASLVTLTFDSQRAYPNYNVMGVAKSALEAEVRYLAYNLGREKIRVNAVSAGPLNTLAARGIAGFTYMRVWAEEKAPLGWDPDDPGVVADAVVYLLSDLSRGVTGTVHYVDGGLHIVAL